jgi:hypothetical protein
LEKVALLALFVMPLVSARTSAFLIPSPLEDDLFHQQHPEASYISFVPISGIQLRGSRSQLVSATFLPHRLSSFDVEYRSSHRA